MAWKSDRKVKYMAINNKFASWCRFVNLKFSASPRCCALAGLWEEPRTNISLQCRTLFPWNICRVSKHSSQRASHPQGLQPVASLFQIPTLLLLRGCVFSARFSVSPPRAHREAAASAARRLYISSTMCCFFVSASLTRVTFNAPALSSRGVNWLWLLYMWE